MTATISLWMMWDFLWWKRCGKIRDIFFPSPQIRNSEKSEGLYLLFLKEITVDGYTRDLGLTITGREDMLEKHYAALLKAFESSVVSR